MYKVIKDHLVELSNKFSSISDERKSLLGKLADYISGRRNQNSPTNLIFICTHNSRRSHLAQIWAAVAADYYDLDNVATWSGGTEATAFNINAIEALERAGFSISSSGDINPVYEVDFGGENALSCFSKTFDHPINPQSGFAAVMTCSDADENCPFVPGAEARIATTYRDPKESDGTGNEELVYTERSDQIALEMLYAMSLVH